jgi:hypothetical protein
VETEVLRGVLTPVGHGLWTAILGGVLFGAAARRGRLRLTGSLLGFYLLVAGLHALWDAAQPIAVWLTLALTGTQMQWQLIRLGQVPAVSRTVRCLIGVDPRYPASGRSGRMSPQPAPVRAPGRLPSWNTGQRYLALGRLPLGPARCRPRARSSEVDDLEHVSVLWLVVAARRPQRTSSCLPPTTRHSSLACCPATPTSTSSPAAVSTSGGIKRGRGLSTRDQTGAVVGVDLAGRLSTRVRRPRRERRSADLSSRR